MIIEFIVRVNFVPLNEKAMNSMKSLVALLLVAILFSSCKKDKSGISNTIVEGSWKISLFEDSGNDETAHFSGYKFSFSENGNLQATNGGNVVSGGWSEGDDDSTNKLNIHFNASPFDDLTDDWHVIEQTAGLIKLEDVSGGNGGTDYLTFVKN